MPDAIAYLGCRVVVAVRGGKTGIGLVECGQRLGADARRVVAGKLQKMAGGVIVCMHGVRSDAENKKPPVKAASSMWFSAAMSERDRQ
jgi:hypothetical protein